MWSSAAPIHLLQGSTCCTVTYAILHNLVALSYCCLRISLKQSGRSSLTFDVNKEFSQRELPLARYFLFFRPFSVIPRGGCEGKNPSMSAVSELLRPACLAPTTMPHSESLNFPFVPILMLSFHFSTVLLPLSALLGWLDFCINNEVNRCT